MANLDLSTCWVSGTPPSAMPSDDLIETHGSLVAFQIQAVAFLSAWLPLAPIIAQGRPGAITYADAKTVVAETLAALKSIGISLVVGLDAGERKSALLHGVLLDPFRFSVNIAESPITNRGASGSGITASRCAEHVMLCLSGSRLGNGVCAVRSFTVGGEQGTLQTAEVTFTTAYTITLPATMLAQ